MVDLAQTVYCTCDKSVPVARSVRKFPPEAISSVPIDAASVAKRLPPYSLQSGAPAPGTLAVHAAMLLVEKHIQHIEGLISWGGRNMPLMRPVGWRSEVRAAFYWVKIQVSKFTRFEWQ